MKTFKKIIRKVLSFFGLSISRISSGNISSESRATTEAAFDSMLRRKCEINTAIDIGASDGRWSNTMMHF
jgi:hypothetical protein